MMWWFWSNWGWWGMLLNMLLMIVFWGGLIALVVWIVVRLARTGQQPTSQMPLDIARTRYARGEITKEEFERLKKDLS